MSIEEQLEALVRRAVVDGLADSRSLLREEIRAAMAETATREGSVGAEDEVDTKAAAVLAHVQPRTINEWTRRGWLTPIKHGRSHVFLASDVIAVARDRGAPRKILDYEAEARRILSLKEQQS